MFYIFHGDDDHSRQEQLADFQAKLGDPAMLSLNTSRFDGRRLSFSELRHACDSIPFLADKRLVIVDNLISHNPDYLAELIAYLPALPGTTRLVFMESKILPESHEVVLFAKQTPNGYVKLFNRLKDRQLDQWIRKRVKDKGGQITNAATHFLAANAGNDLTLLNNEIEKLVLYKGAEPIEPADVNLLCPHIAEANVFDLVDAIGSRHGRTAARLLQEKLAEGTDPFFLFSMIVRQFRLLIQVKELAETGSTPPEIALQLSIKPFIGNKLTQQSHNFSQDQLDRIFAHLLEIDVGVKTGQTDLVTALVLLVGAVAV